MSERSKRQTEGRSQKRNKKKEKHPFKKMKLIENRRLSRENRKEAAVEREKRKDTRQKSKKRRISEGDKVTVGRRSLELERDLIERRRREMDAEEGRLLS